jgi:hypothetical protein
MILAVVESYFYTVDFLVILGECVYGRTNNLCQITGAF